MTNREKLTKAIGNSLDQVNERLDKKETPNFQQLEALEKLVNLTSVDFKIDNPKHPDTDVNKNYNALLDLADRFQGVPITKEKAEIVTFICKECQKQELTLIDVGSIFSAVMQFYFENSTP